jgi:hypothetical protein
MLSPGVVEFARDVAKDLAKDAIVLACSAVVAWLAQRQDIAQIASQLFEKEF